MCDVLHTNRTTHNRYISYRTRCNNIDIQERFVNAVTGDSEILCLHDKCLLLQLINKLQFLLIILPSDFNTCTRVLPVLPPRPLLGRPRCIFMLSSLLPLLVDGDGEHCESSFMHFMVCSFLCIYTTLFIYWRCITYPL